MIKLLILDVDGILTDGKKYYNNKGDVVMKTFCDKDWTAIKRFKALGTNVVFLTGDPFNKAIAKNRNIDVYINRKGGKHTDKSKYVDELCKKYKVSVKETAFAGDDIFDIEIMKKIKWSFCPMNSPSIVQQYADVIDANSGENFVMTLFDLMLDYKLIPKHNFNEHLAKVYNLDEKEKF